MRLAIVVPTLDEEQALSRCLPAALAATPEVVVSDGGSRDGTVALARRLGARVLVGPAGRGGQLDRGAAAAAGELLVFLHADTVLPAEAPRLLEEAAAGGCVGGGFRLAFDVAGPALRLGERWINLRTRFTRCPLGDQAQFATRAAFEAVGGFPDWPILEDLHFMRALKRHGRIAILPAAAVTSSRRFVELGWPRTVATNWLIWALYFGGVSPHRLARLYRRAGAPSEHVGGAPG